MHRIKTLIVLALMACSLHLSAQELEYKMEIGGMAGLSSYLGDANYTNPRESEETLLNEATSTLTARTGNSTPLSSISVASTN